MRFIHFIVTLFFIALLAVGACGTYFVHFVNKSGPLQEDKAIVIEQGWGLGKVAHVLEAQNVIYNADLFKILGEIEGVSTAIRSGEYLIEAQAPMRDVLISLTEGLSLQRQITFPEGATSYEMVRILNQNQYLSGDIVTQIPDEGSLHPETYNFSKGMNRKDVISRMQIAQTQIIDRLWESRAVGLPLKTKSEALTLASIIEKETGVGGERRKVAGVFINRLNRGMLLQTDPTVIYALTLGKHQNDGKGPLGRRLLRKDLKIDSPYNTYRFKGLPPTPIANPGEAAIAAALNPEQHDYLYFVADGTGGHAFAKTLDGHNKNVAKWRKIRKQLAR